MSFDQAFTDLVDIEKGISMDPTDPGNWTGGKVDSGELKGTKFGISAAAYPTLDIANLTTAKAKSIYLSDYWDKCKCDALPDQVASVLFKEAVNMGVSGGIKRFQESLGVTADGNIGNLTIGYATKSPQAEIIENYLTQCAKKYIEMKNFPIDGVGWMRRLIKTALQAKL